MDSRTNIRRGMAVMSDDGVQVGRVIDVTADGIVIEKGQFFLRDFRLPFSEISQLRGDELVLVRDYATLRRMDSDRRAGTAKGTVGVAGSAAPPPQGGLGLGPADLTEARMDSAKFQDHGRYDFRSTGEPTAPGVIASEPPPEEPRRRASEPEGQYRPPPDEPPIAERRAAGPGWDPLSVDEADEEKEAPRTSGPDADPSTRY